MQTKDPWVTRESLLLKVKEKGDEEAWQEFSDYYLSFVETILKKMNITEDIYNDITQEILLGIWRVFQSKEGFNKDGKFRNWLSSVIYHKAHNYSKKHKIYITQNETFDKSENDTEDEDDIQNYIDREWKLFLSNRALEETKKHFRGKAYDVFLLDLEGKSTEEICQELSLSVHAVYTYRARFKKQLVVEIRQLQEQFEQA